MKRKMISLLLLLFLPLLSACGAGDATPTAAGADIAMLAKVTAVGEKLEVTVIEGEYGASGTYWVHLSDTTLFLSRDNKSLSRNDVKVGDTVKILYSGQVMLSNPPQIAAKKVIVQ